MCVYEANIRIIRGNLKCSLGLRLGLDRLHEGTPVPAHANTIWIQP